MQDLTEMILAQMKQEEKIQEEKIQEEKIQDLTEMILDQIKQEEKIQESAEQEEKIQESAEQENVTKSCSIDFQVGFVSCDRLNVRKRPTLNSEIVCIISKNDKVKVINPKPGHEFYKVVLENGTEGFCMKKFIKLV